MTSVPQFQRGSAPSFQRDDSQPKPAQVRANRYGAQCSRCGVWVAEGEGRLSNVNGQWVVSHVRCPEAPQVGQDAGGDVMGVARQSATSSPEPLPDGRYTVIWSDGYKTIRVRHQGEFDDFMPGKQILSFLSGANNDTDYTSFAHVDERGEVRVWKKHQGNERLREAVKVLLGDPRAASKAYARESGCCGRCGRTLTTPESIEAGIGPECAQKLGW